MKKKIPQKKTKTLLTPKLTAMMKRGLDPRVAAKMGIK